jgi:hypothetical protein
MVLGIWNFPVCINKVSQQNLHSLSPALYLYTVKFMAGSIKKPANENLDEMLKRIRSENKALERLIRALETRNAENGEKLETNKS